MSIYDKNISNTYLMGQLLELQKQIDALEIFAGTQIYDSVSELITAINLADITTTEGATNALAITANSEDIDNLTDIVDICGEKVVYSGVMEIDESGEGSVVADLTSYDINKYKFYINASGVGGFYYDSSYKLIDNLNHSICFNHIRNISDATIREYIVSLTPSTFNNTTPITITHDIQTTRSTNLSSGAITATPAVTSDSYIIKIIARKIMEV